MACEFSGVVRQAFVKLGHAVTSVDLLPAEDGANYVDTGSKLGFHRQEDVFRFLAWRGVKEFDLMIAHPPCTDLAVSGARWFKEKAAEQERALDFVRHLMALPTPRIAIENPVSVISTKIRKPDQIIQPYNFGDPFRKTTCLWLKNLPKLKYTSDLTTGEQKCWKEPPSPDRWKNRSRTYPGFANAMAEQWGRLPVSRGDATQCRVCA